MLSGAAQGEAEKYTVRSGVNLLRPYASYMQPKKQLLDFYCIQMLFCIHISAYAAQITALLRCCARRRVFDSWQQAPSYIPHDGDVYDISGDLRRFIKTRVQCEFVENHTASAALAMMPLTTHISVTRWSEKLQSFVFLHMCIP